MYSVVITVINTVFIVLLKVVRIVDLKCSHHDKNKNVNYVRLC